MVTAAYTQIDRKFVELMPTYNKNWLTLNSNAFIDDVNLNRFHRIGWRNFRYALSELSERTSIVHKAIRR